MSKSRRRAVGLFLAWAWMLGPSVGQAQNPFPPEPSSEAPARENVPAKNRGYLKPKSLPASRELLPPPPGPGSPGEARDRAAFFTTRHMKGTPRWDLATEDARYLPKDLLADFACVLGVRLQETNAPTLVRLLNRLRVDVGESVESAKAHYKHPRPFVGTGQPICEDEREYLKPSFSYPSGHSTLGWASGLVMAELVPELATPLMARARAYGESRVICGVHTVSDVEAGRTVGAVLVATLHASDEFKADLEGARREIAAARGDAGPLADEATRCAVEKDAAARSPWDLPSGNGK